MELYNQKPELLKEDIQLARDYGIKISDQDLKFFMQHLISRRAAEVQAWRQRQIDLDTFD